MWPAIEEEKRYTRVVIVTLAPIARMLKLTKFDLEIAFSVKAANLYVYLN